MSDLPRQLLKRTTSRCPECHASSPAEVWRVGEKPGRVFLNRTCATHGETSVCIASDARFYWLAKGKPGNACCAADGSVAGTLGRNAKGRTVISKAGPAAACCQGTDNVQTAEPFETLSTCLALIEIVNSCNLACPTCYADSTLGSGAQVDAFPLEDLQTRIQAVIDRKGAIEILQLSGGEPTLHPRFFELVDWVRANPGIDYLLVNTNGVRIAADESFARRLAETVRRGRIQLYLQFDGIQVEGQHFLRGADLRRARQQAIERCGQMNLPITLAMTVTSENLGYLWQAIEFGLRFPHIRGLSFQPMFLSGRAPTAAQANGSYRRGLAPAILAGAASRPMEGESETTLRGPEPSAKPAAKTSGAVLPLNNAVRLNTADIILAAVEQSGGRLRFEDFTPLPCGDPNCATIGYLLKANGRTHSVSDFVDFTKVQNFLRDKVRYNLEDLVKCGCDSQPLGDLLRRFEMNESNTFRLFIKPFMDAWTWDEDRIDRCCTHVIRPDGKLDSFCRYYSGFADAKAAP